MTHLDEFIELHDIARNPAAPSREIFEERCRENPDNRSMHHHVFISQTVVDLCRAADLRVLLLRPAPPCHILCLCRVDEDSSEDLTDAELKAALASSPFASDRNGSQ
jgi:hypothetical protein